jgi:hypothetical protein
MQTIGSASLTINRIKSKLIEQARKKGLVENFGQTEIRKLFDQCDPYGTPEQRKIHAMVQQLDKWAMEYEGK